MDNKRRRIAVAPSVTATIFIGPRRTLALTLTKKMNGHHIYVRMAKWPMPAIQYLLCKDKGISFVNLNDLVEKGLEDLPGIFAPAKASDLKRIMK